MLVTEPWPELTEYLVQAGLHQWVGKPIELDDTVYKAERWSIRNNEETEDQKSAKAIVRILVKEERKKNKASKQVPREPSWHTGLRLGFRLAVIILLLLILFFVALPAQAQRRARFEIQDEGTRLLLCGGGLCGINHAGAGVVCAPPIGNIVTCTITGGGTGSQHQIDGVNLTSNDPINFLDTTEFDWTNPAAGNLFLAIKAASIDLTTKVTATLPVTNGGTGTPTAFTLGSVVFAGPSGVYTQDINFCWHDINNRLGIGTCAPDNKLSIVGTPNALADLAVEQNYHLKIQNINDIDGQGVGISFGMSSTDDQQTGAIVAERTGGNGQGTLQFYTKQSILTGVAPVLALTLDQSGNTLVAGALTEAGNAVPNVTESPAAGDISGSYSAGLTIDAGAVASAELATANKTITCNITLFRDTGLKDTDDLFSVTACSRPGRALTITVFICECDAGSPIVNAQRDDGTPANILTSNLTCTTSGATGTLDATEKLIAATDRFDFVAVSGMSGANQCSMNIQATVD